MTTAGLGEPGPAAPVASEPAATHAEQLRARARRQRRIDAVFGDVIPATTDDEREPGEHDGFDLAYYRANRPPHHVSRI